MQCSLVTTTPGDSDSDTENLESRTVYSRLFIWDCVPRTVGLRAEDGILGTVYLPGTVYWGLCSGDLCWVCEVDRDKFARMKSPFRGSRADDNEPADRVDIIDYQHSRRSIRDSRCTVLADYHIGRKSSRRSVGSRRSYLAAN